MIKDLFKLVAELTVEATPMLLAVITLGCVLNRVVYYTFKYILNR